MNWKLIVVIQLSACQQMAELLTCLRGDLQPSDLGPQVILPNSKNYTFMSTGERDRVKRKPAGIFMARSANDVLIAVKCAFTHKIRVVPRGGGHSYESFGSQDGSLTIDLSLMNKVTVTENKGDTAVATVEGGARLGKVYKEIYKQGGFTFNAGTCPTVAIGGHISGGGYGMLSRMYGLASDQVLEMKVVTADGRYLKVNSYTNSDLFWALRGGGSGSFDSSIHYVRFYFDDKNTHADVIKLWQEHFPTAENRLVGFLLLDKSTITLMGQFTGPHADFTKFMEKTGLLKLPGISRKQQIPDCTALGAKAFMAGSNCNENSELLNPPVYLTKKDYGKYKSDYVSKPLTKEGIETVINHMRQSPGGYIIFDPLGGAIKDIPETDTPFGNRKNLFQMQYMVYLRNNAPKSDKGYQWLSTFENALKPYVTGQKYQNYADMDIGSDFGVAYYGADNFKRLQQIKKKYDPNNIFRNEQSIPVA